MHKKFLRTLTLVFMQGVLFWCLGLQESAAMDPRLQLEAEQKRYLKSLKAHDSILFGHADIDGRREVTPKVRVDSLTLGVPVEDLRTGCWDCYVSMLHAIEIHMTLQPDSPRTSFEASARPLLNDLSVSDPHGSAVSARLTAECYRGRTPAGVLEYASLRRNYSALLATLAAHNELFTTHTTPVWPHKPIKKGKMTEEDIAGYLIGRYGCDKKLDNLNCLVCKNAARSASDALIKLTPTLSLNALKSDEYDRMHDPSRTFNNSEKFAAHRKRAKDCLHCPPGQYVSGKHRRYEGQGSLVDQSIFSLNPDSYGIDCKLCKGHVHDAIQVLLSDPELSEKTTRQYREYQERARLESEELMRKQQKESEREAEEKNKLDGLLLAAKDGTADAQYAVGVHLSPYNSFHTTPSALPWFRLAADQGHKDAAVRLSSFLGEEKYAEETSLSQTYASLASCRNCAPHNKQESSAVPKFTYRTVPGPLYPTTVTDTTWVTQTTVTPVPSRNIPTLNTILATVLKMKVDPSYNVRPDQVTTSVGCTFCDPLLNTAFLQLYKSRQSPDDIGQMSARVYKKTFGQ